MVGFLGGGSHKKKGPHHTIDSRGTYLGSDPPPRMQFLANEWFLKIPILLQKCDNNPGGWGVNPVNNRCFRKGKIHKSGRIIRN